MKIVAGLGSIDEYIKFMPDAALAVFDREAERGRGPVLMEALEPMLLSRLRMLPDEEFARLPDASEGPSDFQIQSTLSLLLRYHRHSLSPDMQRHKSEHIQPVSSVLHICAD